MHWAIVSLPLEERRERENKMPNFKKAVAAIAFLSVGAVLATNVQAGQFRFNSGVEEKSIIIVGGKPVQGPQVKPDDIPQPQVNPRIKFQSKFLLNSLNPQPLPPKEIR